MTKRVESLRAPCLDASSTLATSTKNSSCMAAFFVEASRSFSWWRLGKVVCAVVGIVAEAYCYAIYKYCADSQNTNKFAF